MGRPINKSDLNFRVTKAHEDMLNKISDKTNKSKSEILRLLITFAYWNLFQAENPIYTIDEDFTKFCTQIVEDYSKDMTHKKLRTLFQREMEGDLSAKQEIEEMLNKLKL